MRSMHSTSKTTCSARTSATVRATVMTGSGSGSGGHHGQPLPQGSHIPVRPRRHGSSCPTGAPNKPKVNTARLVGLGRSPVSYQQPQRLLGGTAMRFALVLCCSVALLGSVGTVSAQDWTKSKWGPNDEIGAANYMTPELVLKAAQL